MSAGFPKLGAGVAVASMLETAGCPVTPGGIVGVVEMEYCLVLRAEMVASKEVPKPPTGAHRR